MTIEILSGEHAGVLASPIEPLMNHLQDVAKSPLAFVAYCLVVLAWVVTIWLRGRPERKTKDILSQFKDDARLSALKTLTGQEVPAGLTGNDAVLQWVNANNKSRSKVLLLIAWGMTLVAAILLVTAWRATTKSDNHTVQVEFHREGTVSDCANLGPKAQLVVTGEKGTIADAPVVENCKASFTVASAELKDATVSLRDSGSFSLADSQRSYPLTLDKWDVYVTTEDHLRLRLSLFSYAGDCPAGQNAYSTFQELLRTKLGALRGIFSSTDHRFDYLSRLTLVETKQALEMTPPQFSEYFNTTLSLQVLDGMCFSNNGTEIMRSRIFLGTLRGNLPEPLTTDLPLAPTEFGTTRDMHTASILFALGQDAHFRGMDQDVVIQYLSRAREKASRIQAPAGRDITRAIDEFLLQIGANKRMDLGE
jgi:hypothetical protein